MFLLVRAEQIILIAAVWDCGKVVVGLCWCLLSGRSKGGGLDLI